MTLSLASQATTEQLRIVFEQIGPQSCPHVYNFHMHSRCSDGRLSPAQIVDSALKIGLSGFAITDHHTVAGYREASRLLPEGGPILWSGTEINGKLLDCEVHILAYGFDPDCATMQPYLQRQKVMGAGFSAEAIVESIHAAGGLAILAHPFRYARDGGLLIVAADRIGMDGVEAYYCYKNPEIWSPSKQATQRAVHLARELKLYTTCGTDTHGTNLLRRM